MAQSKQRLVDGPDQDLLEAAEVAAYLRVSAKTLKRLVETGEFPRPIEISEGVRVWDWKDCLYWKLRSELRPRLRPSKKPTDGHSGTNKAHGRTTGKRVDPPA